MTSTPRIRSAVRALLVTTSLVAGLAVGTATQAHARGPDIEIRYAQGDLKPTGAGTVFLSGCDHVVSTGVQWMGLVPVAMTNVRISVRPALRVTVNGETKYGVLLGEDGVEVSGTTPPMAGTARATGRSARATAVLPAHFYRPGLYQITTCVDSSAAIVEVTEINNCASEFRTL